MPTRLFRSSPLWLSVLALAACGTTHSDTFDGDDDVANAGDVSGSGGAPVASGSGATGGGVAGADSNAGETYAEVEENEWVDTATENMSTFGVDVDTASYSLMRRDLTAGRLPVPAGVRPEEFLNYFTYDYAEPQDGVPFAVYLDGAPSPFGENAHLVRVGLQGKRIAAANRKAMNLVFLVDVSGSMMDANKLGLVQYTLKQLVRRLEPTDKLSIVTYAGNPSVVIAPTPVTSKASLLDAIDSLSTGGGTNGEGGIRAAYQLAEAGKMDGAESRVVLCTDGDFNIGLTGAELTALMEQEREKGITLSAFGFGSGNYNDAQMQELADKGNGNYAYIDGPGEANRVLGEKLVSTLQVIAKDVKVQVEFDASVVRRYRLIGYENRVLDNEDFTDDEKDAGELGAGHSVTAFYEVELSEPTRAATAVPDLLANVHFRYKLPELDASTQIDAPLGLGVLSPTFAAAPTSLKWAAGVAEFAEILRRSKHSTGARFTEVEAILQANVQGATDRTELLGLVPLAKQLWQP